MDRTRIAYLLPTETSAAFVVINTHLLAGYMIEYFRNHTSHMICEIIYIDFNYLVFICINLSDPMHKLNFYLVSSITI